MINIEDYDIFKKNVSTLQEVSLDDANAMTTSQICVVHFDAVAEEYYKKMRIAEPPQSNDALYVNKQDRLVFIEFKNGYIDNAERYKIIRKIYDSVIILSGISGMPLSEMREKVDYILVINESKNPEDVKELKEYIQPSKSSAHIANVVSSLANKRISLVRLKKRFENYCFKNVDVFTKAAFEQHIVSW